MERPSRLILEYGEGVKLFVYCEDCDEFLYVADKDGAVNMAVARDRCLIHQDLMPGHLPFFIITRTATKETPRFKDEKENFPT